MSEHEMEKIEEEEEEEEENEIVDHWSHEHPLSLVETRGEDSCCGCLRYFRIGEQAYGCSKKKCGYTKLLHEECAELPRKITHSMHDEHILVLQKQTSILKCGFCDYSIWEKIGYKCTSSECEFGMHVSCARRNGMMKAVVDDDGSCTVHPHPSHPPNHQLRFVGKTSSFKCDACGTMRRGKSYVCTSCEYWIHERCASLPQTINREEHHHSLSLSYHIPNEYFKYGYKCEVCNKSLMFKYWIYHCELCRYAVHVKCAFKTKTTIINNAIVENDIIRLPTDDVVGEVIRPFLMRQGGGEEGAIAPTIPPPRGDDDVNVKEYKFLLHEHQLSLIFSSSSSSSSSSSHPHHQNEDGEEEEEEEEEEEDEENWGIRAELICDGCITPICAEYYMSCSECRYYLHWECFNLPPKLPSLPLLHDPHCGHELLLISCPKHKPWEYVDFKCHVCGFYTNGLMYGCRKCRFKADIKCASLPHTILHDAAAHPQRPLDLLTRSDMSSNNLLWRNCDAGCDGYLVDPFCYSARGSYDFAVHVGCAVLPASLRSPLRWDRHHPRLPLTYDANLNHPGDFYCDECEKEMNPKSWMYHCRLCDLSFHPNCFKTTSGWYRNVKMGQLYSAPEAHQHTLTFQLLTTKRRCDTCDGDRYTYLGFHCASCNFFICFRFCGYEMERDGRIHPIG